MVQDTRWPVTPLIVLRSVQLFLAIIVLAMSAYIISVYDYWFACMALVSALFTIIYAGINFVLLFSNLLLPLAITITDGFLAIFWLISMAGYGSSGYLGGTCEFFDIDYLIFYTSTVCKVAKGAFALSFILLLLFIGSLVMAAIILHKNRGDLRGAKYNSGMDPDGNPLPNYPVNSVSHGGQMGDVPEPAPYYQDPPKNEYYQQAPTPQPYPPTASQSYYNASVPGQPFVSPSTTPAPSHPVAPPPPPVNAAEMPTG